MRYQVWLEQSTVTNPAVCHDTQVNRPWWWIISLVNTFESVPFMYMYVYSGLGLPGSGQSTSQRHFSNYYCFLFSSQHHVLRKDLYIMVCHFSSAFPTNPVYSKQCAAKHESKCSITWTCLRHSCCWYLPTHPTNTGTPRNVCFSWWPKVTLQIYQGIRVFNHDKH